MTNHMTFHFILFRHRLRRYGRVRETAAVHANMQNSWVVRSNLEPTVTMGGQLFICAEEVRLKTMIALESRLAALEYLYLLMTVFQNVVQCSDSEIIKD